MGERNASSGAQDSRLTIGFPIEPTGGLGGYQHALWMGAVDAARERDVNLICFVGGGLSAPNAFEAQANVIYDLMTTENVDGLIVSGSLGTFVDADAFNDFCARYRSLPMVSIAAEMDGIPGVLVDNETGMRAMITHLVEEHGYRRIAFICGSEDNEEAQLRYRVYRQVLEEHGIPFDSTLVAPGDFLAPSGTAAVSLLLDQRGVSFEAIVAANDNMALGALDALQARGVRVPFDVAVVGFDDVEEAKASIPALTTVRQPIYEQGRWAVEALLALLAGKKAPELTLLPPELVVRRSCGCFSQSVLQARVEHVEQKGQSLQVVLDAQRDEILSSIESAMELLADGFFCERTAQLLDALLAESEGQTDAFLVALDEALLQTILGVHNASAWHEILSLIGRHLLPYLDDETVSWIGNLWQQARVMIGEVTEQAQANRRLQMTRQSEMLSTLNQALSMTVDLTGVMDVTAQELPQIGIPGCYIALYQGQPVPPEWSRLVLAYNEKGRAELGDGLLFPSDQLAPEGMLPHERRHSLMVMPLYLRENHLGFVIFEIGLRDAVIYSTLRSQLSSALQEVLLLADLERRALQLQTAAEVSRATSSILDLSELIERTVELARERFGLYYAGLFLVDKTGERTRDQDGRVEPGKWAVLRAGTGEAGQRMLEQGHKLEIGGESMIGQCVANRQARIALDVGEEAVRFDNPFLPETRSELALPLISRDEVIGALTIQSVKEAAFSQEDIAVLQTMADQLANAVTNARLYEQAQREIAERKQAEEALAQEQYLMRALLDTIPDAIYFKDLQSRFIRNSKYHTEKFGLSDPAGAIGKTDFDFFTEEHARPAYEAELEIMRTGRPLIGLEEKETWPDGHETWVSTTKMPLYDEEGELVGTFGISRDITERVEAERAVQDANYALQRRAIQLEASIEVGQAIISIFDVNELLGKTVDLISERFGFYHVGIFLLDELGEWAVLQAATGEAGAQMIAQGHRLAVDDGSMVGWTALHRQPRVALDVGRDAVRTPHPMLSGTRSEMTLPLMVGDQILGVLNVQSTEGAAFAEDDVRILQSMANQVAVAIENARRVSDEATLLEATSPIYRASRRLTTVTTTNEVADAIITSVADTGADGCLVVEFEFSPTGEPETLLYLGVWRRDREPQFRPGLRLPVAESPFPFEMISTLLVVPDVEKDERLPRSARQVFLETDARALVNIPLRSADRAIGQVVVFRAVPGPIPEGALRLYEVLSGQAAVALERARLIEEAQERARREQMARQMIDHIRRSVDVEQALSVTARELSEALDVSHVSIELSLEPPTQE